MSDERELVTVFRSAESDADVRADQVHNLLNQAGLESEVLGDSVMGVPRGTFEVRVPSSQAERAREILAANPSGPAETTVEDQLPAAGDVDPSEELNMEPVFSSMGTTAQMEAMAVHSLLTSAGIEAVMIGDSALPNLEFQVQVPRDRIEEARELIAHAESTGATAADAEAGGASPGIPPSAA